MGRDLVERHERGYHFVKLEEISNFLFALGFLLSFFD